ASGVSLTKPSETLAEQLNLAKGQGLVVTAVKADSAAAKAGLKGNGILVRHDDKNLPTAVGAFLKHVEGDKTPGALALPTATEVTMRGLKLSVNPAERVWRIFMDGDKGAMKLVVPQVQPLPAMPPAVPMPPLVRVPMVAPTPPALPGLPGGQGVMTTSFRTGD